MEILLNLVWAAVAATALCAYCNANQGPTSSARRVQALCALACILFLLFPVVSASDDLHPAEAVLEDAAKRMRSASVIHASVPQVLDSLFLVCLAGILLLLPGRLQWHPRGAVSAVSLPGSARIQAVRAPPRS